MIRYDYKSRRLIAETLATRKGRPHIAGMAPRPTDSPTALPPIANLPADPARLKLEEGRLKRRFWRKLKKALTYIPWAETLIAAFFAAVDPRTPLGAKATLLGALGYFMLPLDAIPDILGALGYGDDLAVLLAAIRAVESSITDRHRERARAWLDRQRADGGETP